MYNSILQKINLDINNAGFNASNPALSGLPLSFNIRFNNQAHAITATVSSGGTTNNITVSVDSEDSLLYKIDTILGQSPFSFVDQQSLIKIIFEHPVTADEVEIEKNFFVASLPTDAVQVYDINNGYTSVNYETDPGTIPSCSMQCGVRFFNSWQDEFQIKRFGGAQYISVYDYGTEETDKDSDQVYRDIDVEAENLNQIYLIKKQPGVEETHDVQFKFKTEKESSNGVLLRARIKTPGCFGSEVRKPKQGSCP